MKIQYLNGGLANQVFQYIFVRYAELAHPDQEPWFFDDSFFFINHVHNGFELEKIFGLRLNLLSRNLDEDVWQELIKNKRKGISIPQSLKNLGFPMIMIAEFDNYKEHNPFSGELYRIPGNTFLPEITNVKADYIYYHGYWLHRSWFDACKNVVKKELTFPQIKDERNLVYRDQILNTRSVAVHIRRGDYVKIGWNSSNEFYKNAVVKVMSTEPDATLFVFSDDLEWCMENRKILGLNIPKETVFIEGNTCGSNYIDLQLMSLCEYMIMGKSAFSYLAMLLNTRLKYSICDQ